MTTIQVRSEPEVCSQSARREQDFGLQATFGGDSCVVRVTGELDLATCDRLFFACTARRHLSVVVDLSRLLFMDCCGYGGIAAARTVIEEDGRTLTVRGAGRTRPPSRLDRAS